MINEDFHKPTSDLQSEAAKLEKRVIVARAEGTEFSAMNKDVWKEVKFPWDRAEGIFAAKLDRIAIEHVSGDCTTIDFQVRTKAGVTSGLDISVEYLGEPPDFNELIDEVLVYLSEETDADRYLIFLAIRPRGGSSPNAFKARIYAHPER